MCDYRFEPDRRLVEIFFGREGEGEEGGVPPPTGGEGVEVTGLLNVGCVNSKAIYRRR